MKNYIFGMKAEKSESQNMEDFFVNTKNEGDDWNPYNNAYFNLPENRPECNDTGRITSIPSPYARMHITDLAFMERNCGAGVLPSDYFKAMSHCLDIFELMFHSDTIDFKEKEINVEKIPLISTHSHDTNVINYLEQNPKVKNYIMTLDMFRDEYNRIIRSKNVPGYMFDFTSLYLIKKNGKVIASTSPFTGFYAKADCNLSGLVVNGREILSADSKTWKDISTRSEEFRTFMYSLLKDTGLSMLFVNLYNHVFYSLSEEQRRKIDNGPRFNENPAYRKFNIGGSALQQLQGFNVYIRPDGLDCSYLKYLLYLDNAVELEIDESDYCVDLANRQFNGRLTQWLGVNDILADSLFVLTYDINDNYLTFPYRDYTDGLLKHRCLIPIKRDALNYFSIIQLQQQIKIERKDAATYLVTLVLPLANGGTTVIRREYKSGDDVKFPNGKVLQGDDMKPFAFGIYPFVKCSNYRNMYKVLFYNSFNEYRLEFFKRDGNNTIQPLALNEHCSNKTNSIDNQESRVNCEYHDINVQAGIEFAEVTVDGKYTSLIVPKLRVVGAPGQVGHADIPHNPGKVTVAIDLGTTNTFIAYTHTPMEGMPMQPIREINTHHRDAAGTEWNELTFMNKRVEREIIANLPDKHREDLYLRVNDQAEQAAGWQNARSHVATWLSPQLNEFIPSRIDPVGDGTNYKFPIPTVINFLRTNCIRAEVNNSNGGDNGNGGNIPLLNFSIPFAYYERGVRKGAYGDFYYDLVRDGSKFKWFNRKDRFGNYITDPTDAAAFNAFLSELMFIVRCHLICNGYDLNNCRIIWSYPLSFSPQLREQYSLAWTNAYTKFISPNAAGNIMYTNESRTPIYDCQDNPNSNSKLTLLMDIGGGSTDVIGYKNNEVKFVTSFGFAGNALYLDSGMNTIQSTQMDGTLLKQYVLQQQLFKNSEIDHTNGQVCDVKIDSSQSISTLMNYGFSKATAEFENIFRYNEPAKYMLYIHNAAIVYHVAQLCKIYSSDEMPSYIYLSGNGSKQFKLNAQRDGMIKEIFSQVYGIADASNIFVSESANPKAATVRGALKGLWMGTLAINQNSSTQCVTMLGDSSTAVTPDNFGNTVIPNRNGAKEAVKANVVSFFKMFYRSFYTTATPLMTLKEIETIIDSVEDDSTLEIPQNGVIHDSYFFQYVALVMQQISLKLARDGAAGR